jgi:hypothetical protein
MWLCDIKSLQNGCIQAAPSQSRNRQIRLVLAGFVGQTGLSHIPGSVSRPGGLERAPEGCCLPHSYPRRGCGECNRQSFGGGLMKDEVRSCKASEPTRGMIADR